MSYIRAKVAEQNESIVADHGFALDDIDFEQKPDLDFELDDEALSFVLALIEKVNELAEGEALVVWKEIF
jgi:hypothetical protein